MTITALDVGRQLGLRPHDAVDAELLEPGAPFLEVGEVLARHEAERARRTEPVADRAGDDVHFVEAGAADQDLGALDPGPAEHLRAGPAAEQELDVEPLEAVPDQRLMVHHEHRVVGRQRLSQGKSDLAAANDDDVHRPEILPSPGIWRIGIGYRRG